MAGAIFLVDCQLRHSPVRFPDRPVGGESVRQAELHVLDTQPVKPFGSIHLGRVSKIPRITCNAKEVLLKAIY